VKIAHFQVKQRSGPWTMALTRVLEGLRGVAGVVAVRSMGLITVLYDETRTDALAISGEIVRQSVEREGDEPASEPDPPRRPHARARQRGRVRHPITVGSASMQR
jgi:hypothetical protein